MSYSSNDKNNLNLKRKIKQSLKNYLEDFLKVFYSFGDNEENLNLYEKFLNEFEKPNIIQTLKYCNEIK